MRFPITKYSFYTKPAENNLDIIAVSTFAGKTVKGIAKCHPNDKFDQTKGMNIAAARCAEKIARKRVKRAESCLEKAHKALEEAQTQVSRMEAYVDDSWTELFDTQAYLDEVLGKGEVTF